MHKATKLVKAEVGGECRFVSELEEGRFLVSSAPKVSDSDSDDIQAVGGIRFFLVEKDSVRQAEDDEIRMGHSPGIMKRIRELEASGHSIYDLLEKYSFQKAGVTMNYHDSYADDEDERLVMRAYVDWVNDGESTDIKSNREFYAIQRVLFGQVIYDFD